MITQSVWNQKLIIKENEISYIITTYNPDINNRLTNEDWKDFQPGEFLVFRNGKIIWESFLKLKKISPNR